ncbi:helix-turn-helix transcriptional regulator [Pseudomaricurvus alcaniphilus]|uniref:helix-turn-helix domain-containing protein n=1 Tax=Pseudomaricurvus alcaniphilus TaxID=1166482 RepID=UPI00140DEEA6|nr:helix-turn-helix transcriptional regulator [Pseudomaricurvus alcaniphilus]
MLAGMPQPSLLETQRILALRLKETRKRVGLSQEALADAAEIDRTYVSQLERGKVNPSLAVLVRVAIALNSSVRELLNSEQ